jgi:hypothetical protein
MLHLFRFKSGLTRLAVILATLAAFMALREIASPGSGLPPSAGCWPALVAGNVAALPVAHRAAVDQGALT